VNDILEVQLNVIGLRRIRKAIKRVFRRRFEISENTYDPVNRSLIQQPNRPVDEQTNILVKSNLRRKFHFGYRQTD